MEIEEEEGGSGGFGSFTLESQRKHQEILSAMEQKWEAKKIAVPTDDKLIMMRLRELHEPIILFGEKPEDRRDRLRSLLAKIGSDRGMPAISSDSEGEEGEDDDASSDDYDSDYEATEPRYVECKSAAAAEQLLRVRRWVAEYSLPRAKARVAAQQRIHSDIPAGRARDKEAEAFCAHAQEWTNLCSMDNDTRPLSAAALSASGGLLATGSRAGSVKLWDVAQCRCLCSMPGGHTSRVHDVAMHPSASSSSSCCPVAFASCAADGTTKLWPHTASARAAVEGGASDSPVATFQGCAKRIAFHPSGRLLGVAGEDSRWQLWDLETGGVTAAETVAVTALVSQGGHTLSLHSIAFQGDGALVATGGKDTHIRVWDLRSGKCVQVLEGHLMNVLSLDWSPNGYNLASGGEDNTVFVWDLRKRASVAQLPAHKSLVSCVRYDHDHGDVMVSAGYDRVIKLWSTRSGMTPSLLCEFVGHEGPVVMADIAAGGKMMVSASIDRTWKIWSAISTDVKMEQ